MVKTGYTHAVLTPGGRHYEISYIVLPQMDEVSVEYEIDESVLRIVWRSPSGEPHEIEYDFSKLKPGEEMELEWPAVSAFLGSDGVVYLELALYYRPDDASIERAIERSWGFC